MTEHVVAFLLVSVLLNFTLIAAIPVAYYFGKVEAYTDALQHEVSRMQSHISAFKEHTEEAEEAWDRE